jgi:hypothetical protein
LPLPSLPDYNAVRDSALINPKPNEQAAVKQMNVGQTQTILLILTALSMTVTSITADAITHTVPIDPKVAALVKQARSEITLKQYDLAIRTLSSALQLKPETKTAAAIHSWRAVESIRSANARGIAISPIPVPKTSRRNKHSHYGCSSAVACVATAEISLRLGIFFEDGADPR